MSQTSLLKLVMPEHNEDDNYRLERRIALRHNLAGHVTTVQTLNSPDGPATRICSLQLVNISDTGLGAIAPDSVPINSQIAIFFPPHGPDHGFDLAGTVVRCVSRDGGHELGIRLAQRAAA